MPMFDYECQDPACGRTEEHFVHHAETPVFCGHCHTLMRRLLTACRIIPDDVPGGFVIENLDKTPRTFYSKSAYRDELRARGMKLRDHHLSTPEGSDKNPNCGRRWF